LRPTVARETRNTAPSTDGQKPRHKLNRMKTDVWPALFQILQCAGQAGDGEDQTNF